MIYEISEASYPPRQDGAGTVGLPGEEVSFILCASWSGLIDLTPRGTFRPNEHEEVSGESAKNQTTSRGWVRVFLRIFRRGGIVIDHVGHVGWVLCLWGLL